MAVIDLVMPKLGESIMEATILKWFKQPGDPVKMDETVLEIATDKVDSEVPSTVAGVVEEILFNVNDVVPIGTVIARIKTNVEETVGSRQPTVNSRQSAANNEEAFISEENMQEATEVSSTIRPNQQTTNYKPQTS